MQGKSSPCAGRGWALKTAAARVVLNYTRTVGEESKIVRCTLVKEEDKWLVYAGSP